MLLPDRTELILETLHIKCVFKVLVQEVFYVFEATDDICILVQLTLKTRNRYYTDFHFTAHEKELSTKYP